MSTKIKHRILIMAVVMLLIVSLTVACTPVKKTAPPVTTPTPSATVDKTITDLQAQVAALQKQINNLSTSGTGTGALTDTVNSLKTKVDAASASSATAAQSAQSALGQASAANATLANLTTTVNKLKDDVAALTAQVASMQSSTTTIGTTSVNVNGLSVTFLTNSVAMPSAPANSDAITQLTLRIANGTAKDITNVDVVGNINFSYTMYPASGYPKLTDGDNTVIYNAYFNGTNTINFECYKLAPMLSGKVYINPPISIPKGSSITLRPRIAFQSQSGYTTSSTTVTVSITSISYDVAQ